MLNIFFINQFRWVEFLFQDRNFNYDIRFLLVDHATQKKKDMIEISKERERRFIEFNKICIIT